MRLDYLGYLMTPLSEYMYSIVEYFPHHSSSYYHLASSLTALVN